MTISPLDPEAARTGLKAAGLQNVLIRKMRQSGLKYNANADAELFVRVVVLTSRAVNGETLGYGAHLELSFREKAFVKRQPATYFFAPTWFKGSVTVANPKVFKRELAVGLVKLYNQFVGDYKRYNR